MQRILDFLTETGIAPFIDKVAGNFWNPYTISLLIGTGIILTIATKFIQIRKFTLGWKFVKMGALRKDESAKEKGDISPFQALMTSLAATVGNGNIAGVATAVVYGGPGAIFWMWVTAIVGMATKYSEAILAVNYRKVAEDGSMSGGPMYYIRRGFGAMPYLKHIAPYLAGIFAFCGAFATLFGTGNMMQANSMALAFNQELHIPFLVTGIAIAFLAGLVIIGGIKRIGKTAELLVPGMIILYFFCGILIILLNITKLPGVFAMIFQYAFTPQAAMGGFAGHAVKMAIQFGVRRGLLSNESGLGSTPIAHAASKAKNPVRQGIIAMFDTFIDTIVVCSVTGLIILITGAYLPENNPAGVQLNSTALTAHAFNTTLPWIGGKIVALSSALFGYSTIIGWYYYGERCFEYLFGLKQIKYYKIVYITLTFCGSVLQKDLLTVVWNVGDIANSLMAAPNLVGLIALSGVVYKITKEYVEGNKIE